MIGWIVGSVLSVILVVGTLLLIASIARPFERRAYWRRRNERIEQELRDMTEGK